MRFHSRLVLILLMPLWALPGFGAESRYRIEVVGLECPVCAASMERRLGAIEGVATVETDLKNGTVLVSMNDGTTLEQAKVQELVTAAGFRMKSFGAQ